MDEKKRLMLAVLAVLLLMPVGCTSLTLQFNERTIEVKKLRQARFPRGLEISHFDGKTIKVRGREAININGTDLTVNGSTIRFGDFKGELGPHQKLVVTAQNTISVKNHGPGGDSKSWWQFWR